MFEWDFLGSQSSHFVLYELEKSRYSGCPGKQRSFERNCFSGFVHGKTHYLRNHITELLLFLQYISFNTFISKAGTSSQLYSFSKGWTLTKVVQRGTFFSAWNFHGETTKAWIWIFIITWTEVHAVCPGLGQNTSGFEFLWILFNSTKHKKQRFF